MERTSKKNFIIDTVYAVLVFGLVILISYAVVKFMFPFVAGVIVTLAVQKPANKIAQKTRISKGTAAAILSFLLYLAVAVIACFLAYRIILSAVGFTDYLPRFFENTGEKINAATQNYSHIFDGIPEEMRVWIKSLITEAAQNIITSIGGWITDFVSALVKKMPLFFISGIVTLVASCYIAKDFDKLRKFVKAVVGEKVTVKTVKIKNILAGSVFKMLKGYSLLSFATGLQLYLGFLILKIDKPFTLALLIAAVDLLPVLGTGTVMVPWGFIAVLSGNYALGIGLGILYIITVVIRNFLEPKIIGKQLGINALFTLAVMFLGLKILGVWGLILFPIIFITTVQYYRDEMKEGLSV